MLLRPDTFRGFFCGRGCGRGTVSVATAAYEANGRPAKDVAFSEVPGDVACGMSLAHSALAGRGEWGLPPADEALGRPRRSPPPWT